MYALYPQQLDKLQNREREREREREKIREKGVNKYPVQQSFTKGRKHLAPLMQQLIVSISQLCAVRDGYESLYELEICVGQFS